MLQLLDLQLFYLKNCVKVTFEILGDGRYELESGAVTIRYCIGHGSSLQKEWPRVY